MAYGFPQCGDGILTTNAKLTLNCNPDIVVYTVMHGICDGIEIWIKPDFHLEDISWSIQFDDIGDVINKRTMYGCIENIPSVVQCATFTIWDEFGDGLNYGTGDYIITWNHKQWQSISSGNYGAFESQTICPSKPDQINNSYSSFCQQPVLVYNHGSNGDQTSVYNNYIIDDKVIGSTVFNIKQIPANIYGINEDLNSSDCYNGSDITMNDINNTIPILSADLSHCNYTHLMKRFEGYGARAIILMVDSHKNDAYNTLPPSPNPTLPYFVRYDHWLPFNCTIHFDGSNVDYFTAFKSVEFKLDENMQEMFKSNIKSQSTEKGSSIVMYRFDVNTTLNDILTPDDWISNTLLDKLKYEFLLNVTSVDCIRGTQIIESYVPTISPTVSPTDKIFTYNIVHIPVQLIALSDAYTLINASNLRVGFECNTNAPTTAPTNSPTIDPTPFPTTQLPTYGPTLIPSSIPTITQNRNNELDDIVIFTYSDSMATRFSMAISFPIQSLSEFLTEDLSICGFSYESIEIEQKDNVYFVTIDTVFEPFSSVCVEFDDGSGVSIGRWSMVHDDNAIHLISSFVDNTAEKGCISNTARSRYSIPTIQKGTYCVVAWTNNNSQNNKQYHIKMKLLYQWTVPFIIQINHCSFMNETVIDGKGAAITVTTQQDIDESISIFINDTVFDSNYASKGGGAFYRGFSYNKNGDKYTKMSIVEIHNIKIYNTFRNDLSQNMYSIGSELLTSERNELIFRNAILIKNMSLSHGGGLMFDGLNVYITNSEITNGYGLNGGCMYSKDTAFTLHSTQIKNCTSSNNGGGIYKDESVVSFDLCSSIYYTEFENNYAQNKGGALYLNLYGNNGTDFRESCLKIFNVSFMNNFPDSAFFYVTPKTGSHDILDGIKSLSHICSEQQCALSTNVLKYFCASINDSECSKYIDKLPISNYTANPNVSIVSGASVIIYVFGWDIFENPLTTTYYSIQTRCIHAETIQYSSDPTYTYYNVPLLINKTHQNATIYVYDDNKVADPIMVRLQIQNASKFIPIIQEAVGWIIFAIVLCIFIIILIGWIYRKYLTAFVVKKGLVLIIGITKFKTNTDLPDDKENIAKLVRLWQNVYNYQVFVCNHDGDRYYCTKKDVINFIDQHKEKVADYDGVIVHILSHGQKNAVFITSDGKTMPLSFIIHELSEAIRFSENPQKKILKAIFYHPCRGDAIYHHNVSNVLENESKCCYFCLCGTQTPDDIYNVNQELTRWRATSDDTNNEGDDGAEVNTVIVYQNIPGRANCSTGYFTNILCKLFGENAKPFKLLRRKSFLELIVSLGKELSAKLDGAEIPCHLAVAFDHSNRFEIAKSKPLQRIEFDTNDNILLNGDMLDMNTDWFCCCRIIYGLFQNEMDDYEEHKACLLDEIEEDDVKSVKCDSKRIEYVETNKLNKISIDEEQESD